MDYRIKVNILEKRAFLSIEEGIPVSHLKDITDFLASAFGVGKKDLVVENDGRFYVIRAISGGPPVFE